MAPHRGKVNVVQWNHNNKVLAAAGTDGFISLNHIKGQLLGSLPTPQTEEFKQERFNVLSISLSTGESYKTADMMFYQFVEHVILNKLNE